MLNRRDSQSTSLSLIVKYRPKTFKEFIGNKAAVTSLQSVLSINRVKAFMFSGPAGTGKTTLARIIKEYLNCSDKDFYEYDMAKSGGIDVIRGIIDEYRYAPIYGKYKIYLLDEAHQMSIPAANAILKTLEDCPSHVRFILCTTDPAKVINTIKTRCSKFSLAPLTKIEMLDLLEYVCKKEEINFSDRIMKAIIVKSEGCAREALGILDQISLVKGDDDVIETIIEGAVTSKEAEITIELCRALLYHEDWSKVVKILNKDVADPEAIRRRILSYMTKVALGNSQPNMVQRAVKIISLAEKNWYDSGKASLIKITYQLCKENN